MTLTPAYGRDYKSRKEALADFEAGKDFIANDYTAQRGTYANKSDLVKLGYKQVTIRYKKLREVFVVKL